MSKRIQFILFYALCDVVASFPSFIHCSRPKFLTIKVIVFMTFWQGIAITGMSVWGLVDEQSGMAAQNILICIEMLLASLMHHLFFPYREWQEVISMCFSRIIV